MPCNECANSKYRKRNLALPLIKTVERGHTRCLEAMLQRGDDVNGKDDNGVSVLMNAASKGKLESIRILVHAGVDINAVSDIKSTALLFAAENGNVNCMKYLIRKGADMNACNYHKGTALHYVAQQGRIQTVLILLRAFAHINIKNVGGQSALETHIASHAYVNTKLVMLLFAAGEKIDDRPIVRFDRAGCLDIVRLPIPEYLLEHNSKIYLLRMCRKVIREYLIEISPNQHLFHRIPQIGLPVDTEEGVCNGFLPYTRFLGFLEFSGYHQWQQESQ